jgi:hypothetical protein
VEYSVRRPTFEGFEGAENLKVPLTGGTQEFPGLENLSENCKILSSFLNNSYLRKSTENFQYYEASLTTENLQETVNFAVGKL